MQSGQNLLPKIVGRLLMLQASAEYAAEKLIEWICRGRERFSLARALPDGGCRTLRHSVQSISVLLQRIGDLLSWQNA